jgi:hypothetical protein
MPEAFDAYYKWLGISPRDQPPNYYRLLGIDIFEESPDVIANVADQRMAHIRSFQTSQYAAVSQRILNEIAAARICLLTIAKKSDYDKRLHGQLAALEVQPSKQDSLIHRKLCSSLPLRNLPPLSSHRANLIK